MRLLFSSLLLVPLFASADAVPVNRQGELRNLLLEDCGSCHGLTLKGGLGPSLLASRIRSLTDDALIDTILQGRPGTPMPPWKSLLSRSDAAWIVQELRQRPEP